MPINLDHVGLNTLIQEPVTGSQNTIGFSEHYRPSKALRMPSTTSSITGIITGDVQSTYPSSGYLSVSFWVKLDSGIDTYSKYIFEADDNSNNNAIYAWIDPSSTGTLKIWMQNGSPYQYYQTAAASSSSFWENWNHFVIVVNVSNMAETPLVYLNGSAVSVFDIGGSGTGAMATIAGRLSLMGNDTDATNAELQGSLQHFAFFNKQLSEEEVNIAYNSKDLSESSLSSNIIDYWRLGEEKEFADFSIGTAVTNGLSFAATVGSTVLTIDENIVMAQGYHTVPKYINNRLGVIKTSNYLTALNIHRNGPYGWPAFNSTKIGQNPLTRYQNKNSIFSYTIDGGMRIVTKNGKLRDRFRERRGALKQITESPIYSNHKPLKLLAIAEGEEVEVLVSPGNETQYFGDQQANRDHNTFDKNSKDYEELLQLYNTRRPERSPLDSVIKLDYSQTIFPKAENSGLNRVRERETFQNNFWRDSFADRKVANFNFLGHKDGLTGSLWPLDCDKSQTSPASYGASGNPATPFSNHRQAGLLSHNYSARNRQISYFYGGPWDLKDYVIPLPQYSTENRTFFSASFNYHKNPTVLTDEGNSTIFGTPTDWTADIQSGKTPFYKNYSDYYELMRGIGKEYSTIPEFKISNIVNEVLEKGIKKVDYLTNIFSLTGSNTGSLDEFYKIFSTSELLKNFDIIQETNKNTITPNKITLSCKAIKKLLPYNSFYPVLRSIDVYKSFVKNYKDQTETSFLSEYVTDNFNSGSLAAVVSPLFSPGILYNTIKSGVAVDFPVRVTASNSNIRVTRDRNITTNYGYPNKNKLDLGVGATADFAAQVDYRVPFESILSPANFLKNASFSILRSNFAAGQPDTIIQAQLQGEDKLDYSMLVNNFLAETSDFFMKNENFTTIASLPQGDPNFGNAVAGRTYKMRLKMYRTVTGSKTPLLLPNGKRYLYPQDSGSISETFNMYSNPHGFSDGFLISFEKQMGHIRQWQTFSKENLRETYFPGEYDCRTPQRIPGSSAHTMDHLYNTANSSISASYSGSFYSCGNIPFRGLNYPATPPYYHGEAWADITFRPTETKKHTLSEILNNCSIEFLRHYDHTTFFDRTKVGKITGSAIEVKSVSSIRSAAPTSYPFNTHPQEIKFHIPFELQHSQYATGSLTGLAQLKRSGSFHSIVFINGAITNPTTSSIFIDVSTLTDEQLASQISRAINGTSGGGITYPAKSNDAQLETYDPVFVDGIPHITATSQGDYVYFETDGHLRFKGRNYHSSHGNGDHVLYGKNMLGEIGGAGSTLGHPFGTNAGRRAEYFPHSPEVMVSSSVSLTHLLVTQPNISDGDAYYGSSYPLITVHRYPINMHLNSHMCNESAMQLASSVNLLSKGILSEDIGETGNIEDNYRWIIQTKFETPMLNFKHINPDAGVNSGKKTIGLWHQYGLIPNEKEGVYLKVEDVPNSWIQGPLGGDPSLTGSLAKLCGFSNEPAKLGQLKETKTIKEAVVAIPFVERAGERKFFKLDPKDIKAALKPDPNLVGQSVIDQVQRMKEYVFPPSMDFIRNKDIDPFAMYIFEFTHTLSKQDLADIWQGLLPDIGRNHETAEATISHELLAHELLGSGAKYLRNEDGVFNGLDRNTKESFIEPDIQWMVFKVKKRAASSYFKKIFERNDSGLGDTSKLDKLSATSTGANLGVQYNWPYDFFSLVELVKIDAEVEFANAKTTNEGTRIEPLKLKKE